MADQEAQLHQRLHVLQEQGVDLDLLRAHRHLTPEECLQALETFMAEMAALRRDFDTSAQRQI